jgi:hypothetical protein
MVKVAPLLPSRDLLSSQWQLRWTHTKVFAIAGLDIEAIGSKSLIGFSSGMTLIIKRQNVIFNNKTTISFGTGVTEHEYPAIANTDSLYATV